MTSAATFTAGAARGLWSTEGALSVYSQSVLSTQYVQVPVTVTSPSGSYDPTGDTVQFAFTPATYPVTEPSAWLSGSWATFPGPAYWGAVPHRAGNCSGDRADHRDVAVLAADYFGPGNSGIAADPLADNPIDGANRVE